MTRNSQARADSSTVNSQTSPDVPTRVEGSPNTTELPPGIRRVRRTTRNLQAPPDVNTVNSQAPPDVAAHFDDSSSTTA
ncbi:hypothetical protein ACHQM5_023519 [Ranunculus cassubicifolius]